MSIQRLAVASQRACIVRLLMCVCALRCLLFVCGIGLARECVPLPPDRWSLFDDCRLTRLVFISDREADNILRKLQQPNKSTGLAEVTTRRNSCVWHLSFMQDADRCVRAADVGAPAGGANDLSLIHI